MVVQRIVLINGDWLIGAHPVRSVDRQGRSRGAEGCPGQHDHRDVSGGDRSGGDGGRTDGHGDVGVTRARVGHRYRKIADGLGEQRVVGNDRIVVAAQVARAQRRHRARALAQAAATAQAHQRVAALCLDHGLAREVEAAVLRGSAGALTVADAAVRSAIGRAGKIVFAVAVVADLTGLDCAVAAGIAAIRVEAGAVALARQPATGEPEVGASLAVEVRAVAGLVALDRAVAAHGGLGAAAAGVELALERAADWAADEAQIGAIDATKVVGVALLVARIARELPVGDAIATGDAKRGVELTLVVAADGSAAEALSLTRRPAELLGVAVFTAVDQVVTAVRGLAVAAASISAEVGVHAPVVAALTLIDDRVTTARARAVFTASVRLRVRVVGAVVALLGTFDQTVAAIFSWRAAGQVEFAIRFASERAWPEAKALAALVAERSPVARLGPPDDAVATDRLGLTPTSPGVWQVGRSARLGPARRSASSHLAAAAGCRRPAHARVARARRTRRVGGLVRFR